MAKAIGSQSAQSVNGLFRKLGVAPGKVPRTRPLYRRLVTLVEPGIPRGGVPGEFQVPAPRDGQFGGEPEHILVIAGAQQGLDLVARCLIDPGDCVVIDRPGYLGAIQSFRAAGARLVGWDIARGDVEELDELCLRYRPKLI